MKFQLSSVLAILAVAPAAFADNVDPPPPAADQPYRCAVNEKSASVINIDIGIAEMRGFGDKRCSPGPYGWGVRMAAGDGYSFYIASPTGQPAGDPYCYSVVADTIQGLKDACTEHVADEDRAEGSAWIPGLEGVTYVFITGQSK